MAVLMTARRPRGANEYADVAGATRRPGTRVLYGEHFRQRCPLLRERRIVVGPAPAASAATDPDARVFSAVQQPNPRLPTTPAFQRYREFRPGRTVAQFLSRGGTRRDVRDAVAYGWVTLR